MANTYLKSFGIGVIAGMRSMLAPALLSRKLVRTIPTKQPTKPIHYLAMPSVSTGLAVAAGGELIGDKVPGAPNRTEPAVFGSRIAVGAVCGAAISEVEGGEVPIGAILGGLGAAVGTLFFFRMRTFLDHDLGIPDVVGALTEDALAIGAGWSIVNSIEVAPQSEEAE
jgi:uncharacterized membrane protein